MIPDFVTWDGRIHHPTDNPHPFFRPYPDRNGTEDHNVWQGCFVQNEYEAPFFKPSDVVIDIGMHIGAFSCLAYMHGSRTINGYEVDEDAFRIALHNVSAFGSGILVYNAGVVRSDKPVSTIRYEPGTMKSGCGNVEARAISLDAIIDDVGSIRYLKTDCEGGEFPILYTCTKLDQVEEISGEFHECTPTDGFDCTMGALSRYLAERWGFVTYYQHGIGYGLGQFRSRRNLCA